MSLEDEIKKLTSAIIDLHKTLKNSQNHIASLQSKFISVNEFCKKMGFSKGLFYKHKDQFNIKKIGKRTFVELQ